MDTIKELFNIKASHKNNEKKAIALVYKDRYRNGVDIQEELLERFEVFLTVIGLNKEDYIAVLMEDERILGGNAPFDKVYYTNNIDVNVYYHLIECHANIEAIDL